MLSFDMNYVSRQTYSLLGFLGDVGGLDGAIFIIGEIILSFWVPYYANGSVLKKLFWSQVKPDEYYSST